MRLIGSLTSPFVRKVRIVLAEKKLDYKFELDNPWSADTRVTDANPLGKVPCLVMEGAEALFDSRVIVEYVDTLSPVGRLIPEKGRERAEVRTWEALADGICDAAAGARLEATWDGRADTERCAAWIDRQTAAVHRGLGALSKALAERPWCVGSHLSLADIAVGCTLGYLDFRFPAIAWRSEHANLARLSDKLATRASFIDTLPVQP
ncbi:MAG: glutathione S-transferase C-terminal domain-containing protein [Burkholderiales bacterium]